MTKVAFIGLGLMGSRMATRLIEAGHELTVWNRTPERAEQLAKLGAHRSTSPGDAASDAEVVITMLATPEALEEVVFGPAGVAHVLAPGQAFVDMSTVGPEEIGRVASRLPHGVELVDAPVRGSTPEAAEGRLAIYVGADDETYRRVEPLLSVLGTPRHVGGGGSGAAVKLAVNLVLGAAIGVLGESLALGESLGVERVTLLDVLSDSPIGGLVRAKRANVESRSFPPRFKLALAAKDLRLVTDAARRSELDLRIAPAAQGWLEAGETAGLGELDFSAVVPLIVGDDVAKLGRA
ncbi:MAG TPA: NAD(P)-dependent oxidoreductase [Acidimicrobiales bacterium]|nr:NAD(P)-dependent oxidoreductase [Acidimicrobiales bacterium]